jgi:hypothetical protein
MTTFVFTETVPTELFSTALGVSASAKFVSADLCKAVKLGPNNNYVLCSTGDQVDGFVKAIEPFTVNDGFSFGGVQLEGRVTAKIGVQGASPMAVGDLIVAGVQVALGTASLGVVITGAGVAGKASWKCIRIITGTGVAGDTVLLERP